jgi:hypothetical protein
MAGNFIAFPITACFERYSPKMFKAGGVGEKVKREKNGG